MTYRLAPNGVFWTLNGEGAQLGEPMCFVRLAGCSVGCAGCDTNYTFAEEVGLEDLLARIKAVIPPAFAWPWVWITGGEPTDQDVHPLIDALRTISYRVALATSGVREIPYETALLLNWISVSPHGPESLYSEIGHEVKLVPGLGKLTWENMNAEKLGAGYPWKFIQPLPLKSEVDKAVEFVKQNPGWRLSPQAHKQWRIA